MHKLYEKIFVIAMLFYTTGAVYPFIAGYQSRYARLEGDPLEFALQCIFYTGVFWFIGIHWRTVIQGAIKIKWIILLVLIAIASTAWSEDPYFTFRRSIVLLATTAFGVYFGSRFTVPQQLRLLAWTLSLVVLSSFAIAILLPRYGVDHYMHPGDWQGAFTQKNMLARVMVLAFLVFYFARPSMGRWVRWISIAGAFALLVLSRSVTGALVFGTIMATLPLYRLLRSRVTFAIPAVIALSVTVVGCILIVHSSLQDIFQLVNRNPQLTGRTALWDAVAIAIMKRPFLGYGFNAFWQGMAGESASVLLTVQWIPLHSHNGFLDLMLDLGILGFVTFALGYIALCWRAVGLAIKRRDIVPVWLCTFLIFMFLYNLSESSILAENNIFWVLYIATAVSLFLKVSVNPVIVKRLLQYGT
jgi:exopolysaccharide production protein ExoQ